VFCISVSRAFSPRVIAWFAVVAVACGVMTRGQAAARGGVRITDNLFGTHFVDPDNGWAVGAFGTIYRTRDGGGSWRPQASHTTEPLFSVDFADADHGWIAGRSGLILHTSDGGDTWRAQHSGSARHLFAVKALDPQRAWAIGDWGAILATHDGGATWQDRSLKRDVILNGETWPDAAHGWIVGEAGTILATSDGGQTWSAQVSPVEKTLFGVYFADLRQGWAVGLDGILLHTTDGGRSWQVQQGSTAVGTLEQVGFQEALGHPSLYAVMVVGQYGYAVGDIGAVLASTDGGHTWHRKDAPVEWRLRWIRAVSLADGARGALVGANGLAVRIAGDQVKLPVEEGHAAEATR
jgi:photosystem II stability/assembly factor-like uncharacterized protein